MIYLATAILGLTIGATFTYIHRKTRKRILKPADDNRPFTSEELRRIGIVVPDTYDCETFVR